MSEEAYGVLRGEFPPLPDPRPLSGESAHERFHRCSLLPWPSVLCVRCDDNRDDT
jgi:hypothetical protein